MLRMLLHWVLNAVALLVVSHIVHGFVVSGLASAMIAVVVIGLLNATIGLLLKILTLPLAILTFGIFFLIVNAFILRFASVWCRASGSRRSRRHSGERWRCRCCTWCSGCSKRAGTPRATTATGSRGEGLQR